MSFFSVRFTQTRNGLCTWHEWERDGKRAFKNLVGKPKGNRPLESDGSIILQWALKKQGGGEWTGSICFQEGER
jgi:hypothetical protein